MASDTTAHALWAPVTPLKRMGLHIESWGSDQTPPTTACLLYNSSTTKTLSCNVDKHYNSSTPSTEASASSHLCGKRLTFFDGMEPAWCRPRYAFSVSSNRRMCRHQHQRHHHCSGGMCKWDKSVPVTGRQQVGLVSPVINDLTETMRKIKAQKTLMARDMWRGEGPATVTEALA